MDTSAAAIHARIEACRIAAGLSPGEVDRACGGPSVRKNIARGCVPSIDKLVSLAEALKTTPGHLAFGAPPDDEPTGILRTPSLRAPVSLEIVGEFAAGLWHEVDSAIDESPYAGIAVPPDPAYPIEHQFAGVVKGTSVNRVAPDGSIVSGVLVAAAHLHPKDGDLVAVEQTRGGGHERMRTIKRFRRTADGYELWPDSTDPKWVEPIRIVRNAADEGTTIVVLGVVTWVHRPLDRSERPRS